MFDWFKTIIHIFMDLSTRDFLPDRRTAKNLFTKWFLHGAVGGSGASWCAPTMLGLVRWKIWGIAIPMTLHNGQWTIDNGQLRCRCATIEMTPFGCFGRSMIAPTKRIVHCAVENVGAIHESPLRCWNWCGGGSRFVRNAETFVACLWNVMLDIWGILVENIHINRFAAQIEK